MIYDYVIVGAGIAGCSTAYFLNEKDDTKEILILDRNSDVAVGASGTAGAFLSPLLGKPNHFKTLVNTALKFSTQLYKNIAQEFIINKGVLRIPKDEEDKQKFCSYMEFNDFDYELKEEGAFFPIGSKVNSYDVCKVLSKKANKKFNYEVKHIKYKGEFWLINDEIKTKKLILTTGADVSLIGEYYFNIRAVWGQRIDIKTSTCISFNLHKECSISVSKKLKDDQGMYQTTIGATHHRFNCNKEVCNYCLKIANMNNCTSFGYTKEVNNTDTKKLLELASDIMELKDVEVINTKIGARASSVDYFPMVGELINAKDSINKFPYIMHGTNVKKERLEYYDNLYVLNGVSGRGFVLSPYLAKQLVDNIVDKKELDDKITVHRLFTKWVRTKKAKEIINTKYKINHGKDI